MIKNYPYYACSSILLETKGFNTEAEAFAQVDEWNEQDETAYKNDCGDWQRMSGVEAVASVYTLEEMKESGYFEK